MRTLLQTITLATLSALFLGGCGDSKTQESTASSPEPATTTTEDVSGSPDTMTDAESTPAPAEPVEPN